MEINEALYEANPKRALTLAEIENCHHAIRETFEKMKRHKDALVSYERAVESRQHMSSADPGDAEYLRSLVESYRTLGQLNIELAERSTNQTRAAEYLQAGHHSYYQSLRLWHDLKSRGILSKVDLLNLEQDRAKLQRCTAAMSKSPSSSRQ